MIDGHTQRAFEMTDTVVLRSRTQSGFVILTPESVNCL